MKEENKAEIKDNQVKKDVNEIGKADQKKQKILEMLLNKPEKNTSFPELVDVALASDGKVIYLVKEDKLTIRREWKKNGNFFIPPSEKQMPYKLVNAGYALYYYYSKIFHKPLYDEVEEYLSTAGSLEDDQYLLASLYVFASYLRDHDDIRYMPIYLFCAEPERGKTRIMNAMTNILFRGILTINLLPASIFRYTHQHRASMSYDVMDFWNDVVKCGIRDVFLKGFEKGAVISRVLHLDRGAFDDTESFDVYSPIIIATNEPVHRILGTRCIEILPPNVPGVYRNYSANDKLVLRLKARLTAWKAEWMDKSLPAVAKVDGINGRLWDISKTLLMVCKMVCPEKYTDLVNALLKQANNRIEGKAESLEGRIISIIHELSVNALTDYTMTSTILDKLNEDLSEGKQFNAHRFGRKLKMMGIKTDRTTGRSRMSFDQPELTRLYAEYKCDITTDEERTSENSENSNELIKTAA